MDWFKQDDVDKIKRELESTHNMRVAELKHSHALELKEKEFELKHFKDDEVKKLQAEVTKVQQNNAVLRKENEMLGKITNLNADIIDVKDLVKNLIDKLPEIKLTNLTLNNGSKQE